MLDPFLFAHHELNTMEPRGEKLRFPEDTFIRARTFARFGATPPVSQQLEITGHVQTHEKIFELYLATTNVSYMIRLTPLERILFEIITLHKLLVHFDQNASTERERRSLVVIGCMIQHRLTRLLIDVAPEEIDNIFRLGQCAGINQYFWETYFVGASASARTICSFLELESGRVFLPTVFEDCLLGVDLIVLNPDWDNWCVSIKTGRPHEYMYVGHVHTRPHDDDKTYTAMDRRRIFHGARSMEELYGGTFRACLIVVGKTNGNVYDLNVYQKDVDRLTQFVQKKRTKQPTPDAQKTLTDAA